MGQDGEEEVEVEVGQEAALVVHDQRPAWGLQLISSLIAQRFIIVIIVTLPLSSLIAMHCLGMGLEITSERFSGGNFIFAFTVHT